MMSNLNCIHNIFHFKFLSGSNAKNKHQYNLYIIFFNEIMTSRLKHLAENEDNPCMM